MTIKTHSGWHGNEFARVFAFDGEHANVAPVNAEAEYTGLFGGTGARFTVNWYAMGAIDTATARQYVAAILAACDWVDEKEAAFRAKALGHDAT